MFPLGSRPLDARALRQHVEAGLAPLLAATPARLSLSLRGLDGAVVLERDAGRVQPSASIIKLPILLALLEQVADGRCRLDQQLVLDEDERAGGTGILHQLPSVASLSLAELARLMIVLSDNVATNALIGLLGCAGVTQWCRRAGLAASSLQRRMMDAAARDAGLDNFTSAGDAAAALGWMLREASLPAALRTFALSLLADQRERAHFGAALPAQVHLANKTGQLPGLRHDAGILTAGDCSVVLAVLADGFTDPRTAHTLHGGDGAELLAQIARLVAGGLLAQAGKQPAQE
ncbi:class A beta-lactamase-related serine hydrolase [Cupriavidus basilensis]|uniref:beta-lactamase n=1 Tax=Cupriavidus basilensis TaxID=68895 RepID=A0ABT6B1J1_9BURK|nr:serine hydrolase [Cupriavidus basilensis]MDF3838362.1 class A beta-lactamase-related serine hydrolase [Cupriavidus basilensis]